MPVPRKLGEQLRAVKELVDVARRHDPALAKGHLVDPALVGDCARVGLDDAAGSIAPSELEGEDRLPRGTLLSPSHSGPIAASPAAAATPRRGSPSAAPPAPISARPPAAPAAPPQPRAAASSSTPIVRSAFTRDSTASTGFPTAVKFGNARWPYSSSRFGLISSTLRPASSMGNTALFDMPSFSLAPTTATDAGESNRASFGWPGM